MADFTREFKKKENLETRGVNKGCSALPRVGGSTEWRRDARYRRAES